MTKQPSVRVSDHAVLRYLERVRGFEIESLRQNIAKRCESAASAGASSITIDGVVLLIEDGVVITTVQRKEGQSRRPHRRFEDRV